MQLRLSIVMYIFSGRHAVINVRRLAAVDIAFLGPRFIVSEFVIGVFGSLGLGVFTLARTHSWGGTVFGAYLLSLGVNYVPLLIHAIDLARLGPARQQMADEVAQKQVVFRKYRRQSLLLLVPLVVPMLAVVQWWQPEQKDSSR